MKYGEKGDYSKHGFKASKIYYAMTAEVPEIYDYHYKRVDGEWVPDLNRPIYKIDTLDVFQQELILDGLQSRYKERFEKLAEFHASKKREDDEICQNLVCYIEQKLKPNTHDDFQLCLPLS